MVVRPSSGASNTVSGNVGNGQIDFEVVLSDPFKYIQEYIKKKIRNLEKRKGKLDGYKEKLKSGETLTKDQAEAVSKFGEVTGMLTFANELVTHLSGLDSSAKKERKKRARAEKVKAENERLSLVTHALEMFTLMHLTEPDDKIVTPLRERTSFHPSPGAHLNQFAAQTAKLLINLCDEEKDENEFFINEEEGHVKYSCVKEKLEVIRPKYNPVPEYGDEGSEYAADEVESEPNRTPESDEKAEEIEEAFENGIETETSSPVEINGIEEQNGSEDGYISIQHVPAGQGVPSDSASVPEATNQEVDAEVAKADEIEDEIEYVDEMDSPDKLNSSDPSDELVQIPTTMEFVNREVYGEEDKIKEILVEVSSGFNFLAPPDEPDFDQEKEFKNELGLRFTSPAENASESDLVQMPVDETVSFENSNFGESAVFADAYDASKSDLKDEPTWQQRQQPPRQVYKNNTSGQTNTSYRNSQRYQRNFENRRPTNGTGDQGNGNGQRNGNGKQSVRGQNGGYSKRANFDSRRSAKS